MIRRAAAICAFLALGFTAAAAQQDIAGGWETSQGPMQIVARDDGSYLLLFQAFPGLVVGRLEGNRLVGTWLRDAGPSPCPVASEGTNHWGRFGLQFDPERGFAGAWTYCDGRAQGVNFTGARQQ